MHFSPIESVLYLFHDEAIALLIAEAVHKNHTEC